MEVPDVSSQEVYAEIEIAVPPKKKRKREKQPSDSHPSIASPQEILKPEDAPGEENNQIPEYSDDYDIEGFSEGDVYAAQSGSRI